MAELMMSAPFVVPLLGLLGVYYISKSSKTTTTMATEPYASLLPNVDVPDRNYPPVVSKAATAAIASFSPVQDDPYKNSETEMTSQLVEDNAYYGNAYTDKYFNQELNVELLQRQQGFAPDVSYLSLLGESVDSSYFRHNNMQPFFGSNVRSSGTQALEANEAILDSYTGQGSQTIDKTAMPPLFKPSQLGFVYGAPDNNDFYQSRVNASMRMANVKPFQEVQVGPGVGLGFTACGEGGFNSGMLNRDMWAEKTVDQLRAATNQKASEYVTLGHEVPDSSIKSLGTTGLVNKNRLDTSFAMGEERYFTTTGVEKGAAQYATPVERYVSRPETSMSYVGGASVVNAKEYITGEHMASKHKDLPPMPVGIVSAANRGKPAEEDYGMKSNHAYMNSRTANSTRSAATSSSYIGAAGVGSIGAVVSPLLDMLRPTRKESFMVDNNLRPYAVIQPRAKGVVDAVDAHPPAALLPPTIRETTERGPSAADGGHMNVQANSYGVGGYSTTSVQKVYNQRDTTNVANYVGIAGAGDGTRAGRSYEAEYNQRNNEVKSSTVSSTGRMVAGSMSLFNRDGVGAVVESAKNQDESRRQNTRESVATYASRIPNSATMGMKEGVFYERPEEYASTKLNRFDPDTMLSQLKKNPYVFDINTAFG